MCESAESKEPKPQGWEGEKKMISKKNMLRLIEIILICIYLFLGALLLSLLREENLKVKNTWPGPEPVRQSEKSNE